MEVKTRRLDRVMELVTRPEEFREYVRWHLRGLWFAPVVCISSTTGKNVPGLLETVQQLHEQARVRVRTSELNEAIHEMSRRRRPPSKGARPGNILYATQVGVAPPTIALFVNDSADVTPDYERYLANQLRRRFAFCSVPIRFAVRRRTRPPEED